MKRLSATLLLVASVLTGCAEKKEELATAPVRAESVEYQALSGDYYAPETTELADDAYAPPSATPGSRRADHAMPTHAATTHTVAKGDTLHSLARMYYNDQKQWKDIYTANSHVLNSPNDLRIGQELIIP